ncbi:nuclear transport factor 2 family protein [Pseudanabaenaceae cyanobacterium LEGE 13415]|nr:nuclear transport factor 2 family protein [Pseudanabaenaceae cyanobacterium LEGE 13415]
MNYKALLFSISALVLSITPLSITDAASPNLFIANQPAKSQSATSDRIETVKRFIQAVETRDTRALNQLIADNVVLEQPYSPLRPGGIRVEGKQSVNTFFDRIFRQYSQIRFVDVVFRQSQFDNAVILEGQGDFRVVNDPTPYRNQYIGVIEVADGRIVLIREYFNPLIQPGVSNPRSTQSN